MGVSKAEMGRLWWLQWKLSLDTMDRFELKGRLDCRSASTKGPVSEQPVGLLGFSLGVRGIEDMQRTLHQ